jgi:hypothetical protein
MPTIPSPLSIKPPPTIIQKDVTNEKLKWCKNQSVFGREFSRNLIGFKRFMQN